MQAIVITLDRLATRLIGCYGNEWVETPHLDRFAAQGVVFDRAFADHVGDRCGLGWVTGTHAWRNATPRLSEFQAAGVRAQLIIAETATARNRLETSFDAVQVTGGHDGLMSAPDAVPWARLVKAGIEAIQQSAGEPRLIWMHGPEPGLPPEGFATLYFEDFAERGINLAERPAESWAGEPAVLAGSVSLWDHWLGELLAALDRGNDPTLVLIAAGGGQSGMAAYLQESAAKRPLPTDILADELVRTPCLLAVRGPGLRPDLAGGRCPHPLQPMDVLPTLADWFQIELTKLDGVSLLREVLQNRPSRSAVAFGDGLGTNGLQTAEWKCLVRTASDNLPVSDPRFGDEDWPHAVQLFSKPDDLWDVTDLSTQFPETCESLVRELNRVRRDCQGL